MVTDTTHTHRTTTVTLAHATRVNYLSDGLECYTVTLIKYCYHLAPGSLHGNSLQYYYKGSLVL